ncbi:response regulator transcription factor [Sphingobacterium sp. LRF_L2]|uniref:response regulator transcription factor n=1 Tax=Sphingobacterium sp. LRF_L2 TaxID=3369421 RepID=UPI003F646A3D
MEKERYTKVVFADDSEIHHLILENLIKRYLNLKLLYQAKDGSLLLEALENEEEVPDVAIIDLHMPELNGILTTKVLLKRYPQITVYGFTSSSDEKEKEMMLAAGFHKIYAKNELTALLREISCNACVK